jgi:hypothetical protein
MERLTESRRWFERVSIRTKNQQLIDKLAYYEDLEEQGRLIKLPCKVGDTVYHVVQGRIVEVSNVDLFFLLLSVVENRFDNSVFLTKSEAEAKLEELRGSNE